jgi:hypothetical protein
VGEGVEELIRHVGAGHGSSLLDEGRRLCPGAKSMPDRGFVRAVAVHSPVLKVADEDTIPS